LPLAARRRAFLLVGTLVVLLHAVLLGAANHASIEISREPSIGAPMAVRTLEAQAEPAAAEPPTPAELATEAAPAPAVPKAPRPRASRAPSYSSQASSAEASARLAEPASGPASEPAGEPAPVVAAASAPDLPEPAASEPAAASTESVPASAPVLAQPEPVLPEAASAVARAASASFLATGEQPPPTYRTVLPAPVTLRYQVRRGFFRGTGEIRWQPVGDRYELHLDARLAGITLLSQTSQGETTAIGLAPERFLDQRVRRAPQAANFKRDSGTITFSGPSTEWPLLAGTQDRLSWMIQLVGIVAADPERATEGGTISMVLVGARGEASVRTLRFAGRESAETASGSVPAVKFVVAGRSAYDTSYEIWLDPARGYLPVHATARNGAGESEFDLLLERIE
jgi:hypothetical protein